MSLSFVEAGSVQTAWVLLITKPRLAKEYLPPVSNTILLLLVSLVFDKRLFDFDHLVSRKNKVPFSMAIRNEERMNECFPKHLRMGTARMKYDKETEEE